MTEKNKKLHDPYKQAEKNYAMDVDRMINEGLGSGTVTPRHRSGKIEAARALDREAPLHKNQSGDK